MERKFAKLVKFEFFFFGFELWEISKLWIFFLLLWFWTLIDLICDFEANYVAE